MIHGILVVAMITNELVFNNANLGIIATVWQYRLHCSTFRFGEPTKPRANLSRSVFVFYWMKGEKISSNDNNFSDRSQKNIWTDVPTMKRKLRKISQEQAIVTIVVVARYVCAPRGPRWFFSHSHPCWPASRAAKELKTWTRSGAHNVYSERERKSWARLEDSASMFFFVECIMCFEP